MRSLKALTIIAFALTSSFGLAQSVMFKVKEIQAPVYRNITDLKFMAIDERVKSVAVEFLGRKEQVTKEKFQKRIQSQDYDSCRNFPCQIDLFALPISLERVSCELKVTFEYKDNTTSKEAHPKWGDCSTISAKPADRFLPDLTISEDVSDLSVFDVINDGASLTSKSVKILSYLEDKYGTVIWSDIKDEVWTITAGESINVHLQKSMAAWQERLGCVGHIVVDTDYATHERKKKNNEIEFSYGGCEESPSVENGDAYDFIPLIELSEGALVFFVKNSGRLPLLNTFEKLEYHIEYLASSGKVVFERLLTVSSPLHGFGEVVKVLEGEAPIDSCRARVTLNPNILLKESNYDNNQTEISFCK